MLALRLLAFIGLALAQGLVMHVLHRKSPFVDGWVGGLCAGWLFYRSTLFGRWIRLRRYRRWASEQAAKAGSRAGAPYAGHPADQRAVSDPDSRRPHPGQS